ncbi:hypothetical protein RHS01_08401 [Rhizoctonia solani]|uniref:Reverse transcriptase n=1 Tax=Rhizoctonia solani TaxID=456999 RepID=A0A8H7IB75_9AGAM|nr:hypothetical protein RHS01_08401 [Rhizoctonia solani]
MVTVVITRPQAPAPSTSLQTFRTLGNRPYVGYKPPTLPTLAHHYIAHPHSLLLAGLFPRWPLLSHTFHGNPLLATLSNPLPYQSRGPGTLPSASHPCQTWEVSLERVTRLLLGLLGQVERLEREVGEIKEAGIKTRTNVENISQAVDVVKDGLRSLQPHGPRTPEDTKPPVVEATPRPLSKVDPIGSTSWVSFWPEPSKGLPVFAQPTPVRAVPPRVPSPLYLRVSNPQSEHLPSPPAPAAHYPAPVKVDHPNAYTGKVGSEAKQWLTRMLAWTRLNSRMFPTNQEVLSFLLMNMKDSAGAWAHPHLDQLGSHRAIIQTVKGFKIEFLAAFGNPDAKGPLSGRSPLSPSPAHARTISQSSEPWQWNWTGTTRPLEASLPWPPLGGQPPDCNRKHRPQTLLELQNAALVINNALRKERASHPPKDNKSSRPPNPQGEQEERNRRRAAGACIKCGKMGHKFAECRTGWKATPIEDKGKAKETAKIGKDSEYQSGKEKAEQLEVLIDSGATSSFMHLRTAESLRLPLIDLPLPRTVTMLDGSSPQAGKIWKKADLTFSFDGKRMTETFLICNTGSHAAILGLKWLDAHNPEIDWNSRTLSFPHTPPEHVSIAEEEEADQHPLEGVPSKYHQYAKLTKEGPLNSPLYSMTDAESATLRIAQGQTQGRKNPPSKSSISSPVMFVPKKDGSRRLVLRGAKVFTKLDLRWGYNNVRVKEGDKWKTAFRTKYGLYESLVMTFGLTNAPAAFQHFMNELFKDLLDVCVIIYLDDILVYSKDDASHTKHVHEGSAWIGQDQGSSRMAHATKVKEVQSFLGFANFLRRFVANFSHMARPLHNLVKKDTVWKWETKEQEAFQGLKDAITNAPVLCHADPSKPYFLETDASGAALGSILSQRQEDGRLHPLGFLSESFKGAEQNYNTHNKELLAIIRSFEYWRIFLEGTLHPITVFTDHCNLEYWKESRTFNRRHARWHLLLADQDKSLEEILQFLQNESKAPPSIKRAHRNIENGLASHIPQQPLAGHPGRQRTLELVSRNYYWPGIWADTYWHVDSCETCQRIRKPKYGSIPPQPLEVPSRPWQHVSYDMIVDLPKDGNSDSILVIVDSFTKYVILVECSKKLKAPELADLFLRHVWKRYGMPEKTVSDRGRVFNNKFLKALYQRLGIDPHFSSAYHPQSDGQTERKDWVIWLPMAEFAYNNAVHSSTGKSPFKALYGWEPSLTPSNVPTDVPEADDLATQMESQWREIESALRQSKTRMVAGEVGEPLEFKIGEEAWLDAKNVKLKTLSPKLTEQRLGPFRVTEKISDRAYRLELPPTMRIHDVFYVGLLSKVKRDKKRNFENRPPPVTVDGEEEYKVEGITDMEERNGKWFFRVKWKGYGSEENTWEPRENLKNAEKILKKFEKEMKRKALGAAKALKGGQCCRHS